MTDSPSPPTPAASDFDAALWKAVNAAFDEALETDELSRPAFLAQLAKGDPRVANEVRRLLGRAHAQTLVTNVVRHPLAGLTTQLAPVIGTTAEKGFDDLLQRALRADRARAKYKRHAGELCGAWRLEEIIGVGGMGEVWLATRADGLYHAKAAVKFLKSDGDSERFEARFAQERALLARLNHPGIARLIDAGRLFGQPFLVLEYIEGSPLLNYVAEHAKTVDARVAIIREIGEAVAYAHSQLVVHRDLKPSNVLVTPSGRAKLLDFGVAGLLEKTEHEETTSSEVTKIAGRGLTVEYAAPELITGEASGVASDIYSLASLAYHLLAGHRAHTPEKPGRAALEHAVLHLVPQRVSEAAKARPPQNTKDNIAPPTDAARLVGDIDAIIARAMRIDPADRYRSMEAFVSDLRRWAERRPIAARREDRSYRTKLWLRRNWLPVGLTATLIAALAAGLAVSLWQYQRAKAEAARANDTADYVVNILGRADPDLHGGNWPTALELLDDAAKESSTRFRDQPATEERLSRLFASVYRSLSRDADALPLAQRAVALSEQLHGTDALHTQQARSLLAWVQYWSDDYSGALASMQPVMERLPKLVPAGSPELIEAKLRYGNILAGVYRIQEAETLFREVITQLKAKADQSPATAWRIADAEGDLAAAMTRGGRWQEALDLLRKNAAAYEHPPASDIKSALEHQGNLITVQNILGDPTDVERQILNLIERWRKLAGDKNERIDELLNDLGLYYTQAGNGTAAERTYKTLLSRVNSRLTVSAPDRLRTELDLVDTYSRFGTQPSAAVLADTRRIADETTKVINPATPRFRQLLARAAAVAITQGDVALGKKYADLAASQSKDKSSANELRMRYLHIDLARANGQHAESLAQIEKLINSFDATGEKVSLRRARAELDVAYALLLSGASPASDPRITAALAATRSATPKALPADHRFFRQFAYIESWAQHGRDAAQTADARAKFAAALGRSVDALPDVLVGAWVR